MIAYDVKFVGMVLPGDELTVKLRRVGMRDGNIVVNIETVTSNARLSQVPSMSSLAKVPKNPAWLWTCTIVLLLLVLFGVLTPTSSPFMGSQLLRS